jgi:hypothetical protein
MLPAYYKAPPGPPAASTTLQDQYTDRSNWFIGRLKRMAQEEGTTLAKIEPRLGPPPGDPAQRAELNLPCLSGDERVLKWMFEMRERLECTDDEDEPSDTDEAVHHDEADEACPWDREAAWYRAKREEARRVAHTKSPVPSLNGEALGPSGLTPMPEPRSLKRPEPEPDTLLQSASPERAALPFSLTPPPSIRVSY